MNGEIVRVPGVCPQERLQRAAVITHTKYTLKLNKNRERRLRILDCLKALCVKVRKPVLTLLAAVGRLLIKKSFFSFLSFLLFFAIILVSRCGLFSNFWGLYLSVVYIL